MDIQIFKSDEFGQIRTAVNQEGTPLFCLADLCRVLGLDASATKRRLDDGVISSHPILDNLGRTQQANFVNEDGLYDVILDSRKPEARRFRKWVTSEVLPSIRKHGAYMTRETLTEVITRPESVIILLENLKTQMEENDRLRPKAQYADEVLSSVSCMTTTQVAKELEMSAQELNRWLCDHGIQYRQSGQYLLYADYARRGFAQNRTHTFIDMFGERHTTSYLVWTERGRRFIHQRVKDGYCEA